MLIEVNEAALHYEERGDGAPLILIHGGLASSSQWEPVVPELADRFRVVTPNSRGHGRSTNPAGELSYARIANDIAALIAALRLRRPVVGGWSDGGQVTLELGARHPETAAALIVGAAYPDFDAGGLREAHSTLLGADETGVPDPGHIDAELGEFAEETKALHAGGDEQGRALLRQTAPMWLDYHGLRPRELRAIRTPVLVLAGDRDEFIPLDLAFSPGRSPTRAGRLPIAEPRRADTGARRGNREPDQRLRRAPHPDLSQREALTKVVLAAIGAQRRRDRQAFRRVHDLNLEWTISPDCGGT